MDFRETVKYCEHCGARLVLNNSRDIQRKRFCSHACRQRWRYNHGDSHFDTARERAYLPESIRKRNLPKGPKPCKHCGATFNPDSARQSFCKVCVPDKSSRSRMQRYGISRTEWDALYQKQNGKCALCDEMPSVVDHCHTTGRVRGLLCHHCNMALAKIEKGWHEIALAYLAKQTA